MCVRGGGDCINLVGKQPFLFLCVPPLPCAQMGAYHTIDLVLNQPFTLIKDNWDFITLDRLGELSPSSPYAHTRTHTGCVQVVHLPLCSADLACDPSRTADVAVIIMQEGKPRLGAMNVISEWRR